MKNVWLAQNMVRAITDESGTKMCVYYTGTIPDSDIVYAEVTDDGRSIDHSDTSTVNNPENTVRLEVSERYGRGFHRAKLRFFNIGWYALWVVAFGLLAFSVGGVIVLANPSITSTVGLVSTGVFSSIFVLGAFATVNLWTELLELYRVKAFGIADPSCEWNRKHG